MRYLPLHIGRLILCGALTYVGIEVLRHEWLTGLEFESGVLTYGYLAMTLLRTLLLFPALLWINAAGMGIVGNLMMSAAWLAEIALPIGIVVYFLLRRHHFSAAFVSCLPVYQLLAAAQRIAQAHRVFFPSMFGNGFPHWGYLLGSVGLLDHAMTIAAAVLIAGALLCAISITASWVIAIASMFRLMHDPAQDPDNFEDVMPSR